MDPISTGFASNIISPARYRNRAGGPGADIRDDETAAAEARHGDGADADGAQRGVRLQVHHDGRRQQQQCQVRRATRYIHRVLVVHANLPKIMSHALQEQLQRHQQQRRQLRREQQQHGGVHADRQQGNTRAPAPF